MRVSNAGLDSISINCHTNMAKDDIQRYLAKIPLFILNLQTNNTECHFLINKHNLINSQVTGST